VCEAALTDPVTDRCKKWLATALVSSVKVAVLNVQSKAGPVCEAKLEAVFVHPEKVALLS
jgi:hypothetical protein